MSWFAIGPTLEIVDSEHDPQSFIVRRDRDMLARATFERADDSVRIALDTQLDTAATAEAYRLLARIGWRLFGDAIDVRFEGNGSEAESLRCDRFAPLGDNLWRREAAPFVLTDDEKFARVGDVYDEPMFVPWQFVPVDTDMIDRLRRELDLCPTTRVLDLGCGNGKNTPMLDELTSSMFGIDISVAAVKRCRRIAARPERVIAASATELPWRDGAFDLVVDIGCIHCLPRELAPNAAAEAARVLRPGGVMLSRVFLPRDPAWLDAQPFRTTQFGYERDEAAALFRGAFESVEVEVADQLTFFRCTRGGA